MAKKRFSSNGQLLSRALSLLSEDDFGPQFGVSISYVLELLAVLWQSKKELVKKSIENAEKLSELIIHPCLNVRTEAVKFFASVLKTNDNWIGEKELRQVKICRFF